MAETITIARPYAKAVFEFALAENRLKEWSVLLHKLASAVLDPDAVAFINNPATTEHQHCELLTTAVPVAAESAFGNFLSTLSQNNRLLLLPDILALFERKRAEQEKTLDVDVISFSELSESQKQRMAASLGKRLQRDVTLHVTIDKALMGGAIINAGDLVINGSVRDKLYKLATSLAA